MIISPCTTLALLLLGAVLLSAGCMGQPVSGNTTASGTSSVNLSILITQPVPTQCPPASGNTTPYIIINPIGNHTVGDFFEINGTTNLGVDKKIKIDVDEARLTGVGPYGKLDVKYNYTDSEGYVTMTGGDCGINTWSYQVNLTGFHAQKLYGVNVYSEQNRTIINDSNLFVRRGE